MLIDSAYAVSHRTQLLVSLLSDVPLYLLYGLICLSSYYICRFFPLRTTKWYILLPILIVAAFIASGVTLLLGDNWIQFIDSFNLSTSIIKIYEPWVLGIYGILILVFLLISAIHYVIIAFEQSKEIERRTLELQLLAQDAELRALRAQIDPHFLFNSLNSISALTTVDPEKARSMTILLGDFFRKSLNLSAQKYILLKDELDLISDFLTIEQIRFGLRLKVKLNIEDICKKVMVPPLILQPLVENAVRHGIAHLIEGGTIEINCRKLGNRLSIEVKNPVEPERPKSKSTGLGLKNVQLRLSTLYANEAHVEIESTNSFFHIKINLPIFEG